MSQLQEKLQQLISRGQTFTTTEARKLGINSNHLAYYCKIGKIEHIARGLYAPPDMEHPIHLELQILHSKKLDFVLCLLSALRIHGLTTQSPSSLWVAIELGKRMPQLDYYQTECIYLSPAPFNFGIEEHDMDGISVKVYSAAKTVADCFKFRNKIGLDIAIEALRDGYRKKLFTIPELMKAAAVDRVQRIIKPYVESFTL